MPGQNHGDAGCLFAPKTSRTMDVVGAAARRRGEVPLLDRDPFVCARDREIGKPRRVTLDFVQTAAGWRIADIACGGAPASLRALYKLGEGRIGGQPMAEIYLVLGTAGVVGRVGPAGGQPVPRPGWQRCRLRNNSIAPLET